MVTYKIVEADSAEVLAEAVSAEMRVGWMPTGGVAVTHYKEQLLRDGPYTESAWRYSQAMCREHVVATYRRVAVDD